MFEDPAAVPAAWEEELDGILRVREVLRNG
jgi:hypothetical protein